MISKLAFGALWLFAFSIPWESTYVIPGVGTASRLIGAVALALGVLAITQRGYVRRLTPEVAAMIAFTALGCLSAFWTRDQDATLIELVTYVQLCSMVLLIWNITANEGRLRQLLIAYVCGAYVSALGTLSALAAGAATLDKRFMAEGFDPNELGLTLAVGIPLAWTMGSEARSFWARLVCKIYVVFAPLAIVLTASRGAFAAAVVGLCIVPWSYPRLRISQKITASIALAAAVIVLVHVVPQPTWQRLLTMREEITTGDLNYRAEIWSVALSLFARHPILGVGAGAFPAAMDRHAGLPLVAHNTFISVLVELGIVGIALLSFVVVRLAFVRKTPPPSYARLCLVVLATWFTGVMTLTWEQKKVTWFVFIVIAVVYALAWTDDHYRTDTSLVRGRA